MSLNDFERRWTTALNSILEELRENEYNKLLFSLDKIPTGVKYAKTREEMPQIIIQYYGTEKSITVIKKEMEQLPRMDCKVQGPLRPFVDKLKKNNQKKNKSKTTKPAGTAAGKTTKPAGASGLVKKEGTAADHQKFGKPDKKPPQRGGSDLGANAAAGTAALNPAQLLTKRKVDAAGAVKPKQIKTEEQSSSLEPTGCTDVPKAESAPVVNAWIKIITILKSNKTNIHLVAEVNQQTKTLFVTSRLLADALGFKSEDDFKEMLPLFAEVKLQGNKIKEIKRL
ncbi:uncharacterized protein LOC111221381 isoform X2 [Seriola dumerili]|uniref:uncharacterized protein LOC111221381 isoform X2 n=1 Tax=Seriola dumerili TaxID=41447 RepID=UPI000BBEF8DE|nr:uncharacterized protein LOC111221381 isoform X2 [Seriola dumerili]